jgi:hypothetical protein
MDAAIVDVAFRGSVAIVFANRSGRPHSLRWPMRMDLRAAALTDACACAGRAGELALPDCEKREPVFQ